MLNVCAIVWGAVSVPDVSVFDVLVCVMGALAVLSFFSEYLSVYRSVIMDVIVVAMSLPVLCQSGGDAGRRSVIGAVRVTVKAELLEIMTDTLLEPTSAADEQQVANEEMQAAQMAFQHAVDSCDCGVMAAAD